MAWVRALGLGLAFGLLTRITACHWNSASSRAARVPTSSNPSDPTTPPAVGGAMDLPRTLVASDDYVDAYIQCDFDDGFCDFDSTDDDGDGHYGWLRTNGSTPSGLAGFDTGPRGDMSGSGYYAYVEADGNVDSTLTLEISLTSTFVGEGVSFCYHMAGDGVSLLTFETSSDDDTWITQLELLGPQQQNSTSPWNCTELYFSETTNYMHFVALASGVNGDIAIDNFYVIDSPFPAPTPLPSAQPTPVPTTPEPTATYKPSIFPTDRPSLSPTHLPHITPSQAPTMAKVEEFPWGIFSICAFMFLVVAGLFVQDRYRRQQIQRSLIPDFEDVKRQREKYGGGGAVADTEASRKKKIKEYAQQKKRETAEKAVRDKQAAMKKVEEEKEDKAWAKRIEQIEKEEKRKDARAQAKAKRASKKTKSAKDDWTPSGDEEERIEKALPPSKKASTGSQVPADLADEVPDLHGGVSGSVSRSRGDGQKKGTAPLGRGDDSKRDGSRSRNKGRSFLRSASRPRESSAPRSGGKKDEGDAKARGRSQHRSASHRRDSKSRSRADDDKKKSCSRRRSLSLVSRDRATAIEQAVRDQREAKNQARVGRTANAAATTFFSNGAATKERGQNLSPSQARSNRRPISTKKKEESDVVKWAPKKKSNQEHRTLFSTWVSTAGSAAAETPVADTTGASLHGKLDAATIVKQSKPAVKTEVASKVEPKSKHQKNKSGPQEKGALANGTASRKDGEPKKRKKTSKAPKNDGNSDQSPPHHEEGAASDGMSSSMFGGGFGIQWNPGSLPLAALTTFSQKDQANEDQVNSDHAKGQAKGHAKSQAKLDYAKLVSNEETKEEPREPVGRGAAAEIAHAFSVGAHPWSGQGTTL